MQYIVHTNSINITKYFNPILETLKTFIELGNTSFCKKIE